MEEAERVELYAQYVMEFCGAEHYETVREQCQASPARVQAELVQVPEQESSFTIMKSENYVGVIALVLRTSEILE